MHESIRRLSLRCRLALRAGLRADGKLPRWAAAPHTLPELEGRGLAEGERLSRLGIWAATVVEIPTGTHPCIDCGHPVRRDYEEPLGREVCGRCCLAWRRAETAPRPDDAIGQDDSAEAHDALYHGMGTDKMLENAVTYGDPRAPLVSEAAKGEGKAEPKLRAVLVHRPEWMPAQGGKIA